MTLMRKMKRSGLRNHKNEIGNQERGYKELMERRNKYLYYNISKLWGKKEQDKEDKKMIFVKGSQCH